MQIYFTRDQVWLALAMTAEDGVDEQQLEGCLQFLGKGPTYNGHALAEFLDVPYDRLLGMYAEILDVEKKARDAEKNRL